MDKVKMNRGGEKIERWIKLKNFYAVCGALMILSSKLMIIRAVLYKAGSGDYVGDRFGMGGMMRSP